jgi:Protein kinase domain
MLGRGGMGEVWRATDRQLDRPVAVKVMPDSLADPRLVTRFLREARIAARLQHPGITVVHDVGTHADLPFIVMELLHGQDLASVLAQTPSGQLPVDTAVSLVVQAEALQAAHALYRFRTRFRVCELRFGVVGGVGQDRGSCVPVCCTCSWSGFSADWPCLAAARHPRTRRSWCCATRSRCSAARCPGRTGPTAPSWRHWPGCCLRRCEVVGWSRREPCWPGTAVSSPTSGPTRTGLAARGLARRSAS